MRRPTQRRRAGRSRSAVEPLPLDPALETAARRFFPDLLRIETVGQHRHLARVEAPSGVWCVRRWPEGTVQERIAFVHELLDASHAGGVDFVPRPAKDPQTGEGQILLYGAWFDAQTWMPGRPLTREPEVFDAEGRLINYPAPLPPGTLSSVVTALAQWHLATAPLARQRRGLPQAPVDAIVRAIRATWYAQRERLQPLAAGTPHIQRWLRVGHPVMREGVALLASAGFLRAGKRVISHLNLWPSHLLFSDEAEPRLTGLVDFADAAVSSPIVDLAQVVTHFGGWTVAAADEAIGAYASVIPLRPEERRGLSALAALDLVAETGRMLTAAYAGGFRPESAEADALRHGATALLVSLETLAPVVLRGDQPARAKRRRWVYRSRSKTGDQHGRTRPPVRSARSDRSSGQAGAGDSKRGKPDREV